MAAEAGGIGRTGSVRLGRVGKGRSPRCCAGVRRPRHSTDVPPAMIGWMHQCVLCLEPFPRLSREHIIPRALGGHLAISTAICASCNNRLSAADRALAQTSKFT